MAKRSPAATPPPTRITAKMYQGHRGILPPCTSSEPVSTLLREEANETSSA
ncbi:MAG: hypothetical protein QM723_08990 [Myxococcaceae bacterium]